MQLTLEKYNKEYVLFIHGTYRPIAIVLVVYPDRNLRLARNKSHLAIVLQEKFYETRVTTLSVPCLI